MFCRKLNHKLKTKTTRKDGAINIDSGENQMTRFPVSVQTISPHRIKELVSPSNTHPSNKMEKATTEANKHRFEINREVPPPADPGSKQDYEPSTEKSELRNKIRLQDGSLQQPSVCLGFVFGNVTSGMITARPVELGRENLTNEWSNQNQPDQFQTNSGVNGGLNDYKTLINETDTGYSIGINQKE